MEGEGKVQVQAQHQLPQALQQDAQAEVEVSVVDSMKGRHQVLYPKGQEDNRPGRVAVVQPSSQEGQEGEVGKVQ